MHKKFALLLSFCCLLAIGGPAQAICRMMTAAEVNEAQSAGTAGATEAFALSTFTITPPATIEIQPDLPVGAAIGTYTSNTITQPTRRIAICPANSAGPASGNIYFNLYAAASGDVYPTGVPGLGFKLEYVRPSGATTLFPKSAPFTSSGGANQTAYMEIKQGAIYRLTLIKTGEIANNARFSGGPVGYQTPDDGNTIVQVNSTGTTIRVAPNCSVDSRTLNIDFGTFGPRNVSTTSGPNRPVNFKMICTGVTTPTSVKATLSGTPDGTDARLIKNAGTAQSLAIRLTDNNLGTILAPNNSNSMIVQTPVGMGSDFALTAEVLRVGSTAPTAGTIQATATITLDVQ